MRLITADVGVAASERMLANLKGPVARRELADLAALTRALEASITEILAPCARRLVIDKAHRPFVILVAGVNGSGKTPPIGKLARRLAADGTARGGIVIAIARELSIPIRFIGVGEAPEDFGEFDAAAFAAALVEGPGSA